jgi:hypothetical protein
VRGSRSSIGPTREFRDGRVGRGASCSLARWSSMASAARLVRMRRSGCPLGPTWDFRERCVGRDTRVFVARWHSMASNRRPRWSHWDRRRLAVDCLSGAT